MTPDLGPFFCSVACVCGFVGDLDRFTQTPLVGALPPGHFQCPACRRAWRVVKGQITVTPWHTILSEPNRIVPIQAQL